MAKCAAMLKDWEHSHELFLAEKAGLAQSRACMDTVRTRHASAWTATSVRKYLTRSRAICKSAKCRRQEEYAQQPAKDVADASYDTDSFTANERDPKLQECMRPACIASFSGWNQDGTSGPVSVISVCLT